ncbi:MAG: TraC family protein [Brevinematales bacterium]|nr:TraC family protein [Brevinematales bacterium]
MGNGIITDLQELKTLSGDGRYTISEFFQFFTYDPEGRLYIMNDDTAGFIFEGVPMLGLDEKSMLMIARIFQIEHLRPGDLIQVMVKSDGYLRPYLENYTMMKTTKDPSLLWSYAENVKFLNDASVKGFWKDRKDFKPRNFRVFVTYRTKSFDVNNYELEVERIDNIKKLMHEALLQAGTQSLSLEPSALIQIFRSLFNVKDERYVYNPEEILSDQILNSEAYLQANEDHLVISGKYGVVYTNKNYPDVIYPYNSATILGDAFVEVAQMPQEFLWTYNVQIGEKEKEIDRLRGQKAVMNEFRGLKNAAEKKAEMENLIKQLQEDQNYISRAYHTVTVFTTDKKEVERLGDRCKTRFESAGYFMQREAPLQIPLFLSSLPLVLKPENFDSFDRARSLLTTNIACSAPVYGDWKGNTLNPVTFFVSRRGQLIGYDLFNSPENYCAIVYGTSGSGKSYFIQNLLKEYFGIGTKEWTVEVGKDSYKKFAQSLKQNYFEIGSRGGASLNPFLSIPNNINSIEEIEPQLFRQISDLIKFMVSPKAFLPQNLSGIIERTIVDIIKNCDNPNKISIDDIIQRLMDDGNKDLSDALYPYSSTGTNGYLFSNEREGLIFDKQLNSIELQSMEDVGEDLNTAIMLSVMAQISQYMYDKRNKEKKLAVYDEFHNFIRNPYIAPNVEASVRQVRSHGGGVIIGTQSLTDIYLTKETAAIGDIASFQFIFRHDEKKLQSLKEQKYLILNEYEEQIIKSLVKIDGKYSEVFMYSPNGGTPIRLISTPYDQILFSSNKNENTRVEAYMKSGMSQEEAIARVASEVQAAMTEVKL